VRAHRGARGRRTIRAVALTGGDFTGARSRSRTRVITAFCRRQSRLRRRGGTCGVASAPQGLPGRKAGALERPTRLAVQARPSRRRGGCGIAWFWPIGRSKTMRSSRRRRQRFTAQRPSPTSSAAIRMRSGFRPCRMYSKALDLLRRAVGFGHRQPAKKHLVRGPPRGGPSSRSRAPAKCLRSKCIETESGLHRLEQQQGPSRRPARSRSRFLPETKIFSVRFSAVTSKSACSAGVGSVTQSRPGVSPR